MLLHFMACSLLPLSTPTESQQAAELEVTPQPPQPRAPRDGPPAEIDASACDDLTDGGPNERDCRTSRITCGQTISGHTSGGIDNFGTEFYERHKCWPGTIDHDGGDERVYLLSLPQGGHRATAWLDTPCADLNLAAIRVPEPTACPNLDTSIRQCEMSVQEGTKREKVELVSQSGPAHWLLVVEGRDAEEGAFSLQVDCKRGVR